MSELITVIVPIYKTEKYLQRCVDSIINQTYKNLEIILVDDGSPDNSGQICDLYAKLDKRVKVLHKKNGGLSDARNAGIDIAQGEYISFLDSDDWIDERYIDRLYQLLINSNSDISVCNFVRTSHENIQVDNAKIEVYEYSNFQALEQLFGEYNVQMVTAWGKLYKRELFIDIRYPVGRIHEDEYTTYKLIYLAKKIIFTREKLLYYWQRNDSIMGIGINIIHKLHAIDAFKERAEYFKKINLSELCTKSYRLLFLLYLEVNAHKKLFENKLMKESFENDFKNLRHILRKYKQPLKFKVFYELYYIFPKFMQFVYKKKYEAK